MSSPSERYQASKDYIEIAPDTYFDAERYSANVRLARRLVESNHIVLVGGLPWEDPDLSMSMCKQELEEAEVLYGPSDPADTVYRSAQIAS